MIAAALVLALAQASVWSVWPPSVTVGDTVRITRRIAAEPGVRSHVKPLLSSAAFEPLTDPVVGFSEGAVVVRYTLAVFEPRRLAVAMPEIELVHPDGVIERVSGDTAWVTVLSVLPDQDTLPPPRPSLGPVPRQPKRPEVIAFLVIAVTAGTALWGVMRRRTQPRPTWSSRISEPTEVPLLKWIESGESRAVVAAVADGLRRCIESTLPEAGKQLSTDECVAVLQSQRPEWPVRQIDHVLRSLDRARFAAAVPSDVIELARRADALTESLRQSVTEDSG